MPSSHLGLASAADNVENLEQLITDNFEQVDQAMNGELEHTDTTTFSVTTAEYTSEFHHKLTGAAGGAFTMNVPASKRFFMVTNQTTQVVTVQVTGGGGASSTIGDGITRIFYCDGTDVIIVGSAPFVMVIPVTDETSAFTNGTTKITFRMPAAVLLNAGSAGVRASVSVANSSGGPVTVDINEGGTTILSTKLTIDDTEKTSLTAATPPVISDLLLADDAEMTIDIDSGSNDATGLKVTLRGRYV